MRQLDIRMREGALIYCMPDDRVNAVRRAVLERLIKQGKHIIECEESERECVWVDCGGMIFINEERFDFSVQGVRFGGYLRHLPYFLDILHKTKESGEFTGYFCLRLFSFVVYILPLSLKESLMTVVRDIIYKEGAKIHESELRRLEIAKRIGMIQRSHCILCGSPSSYDKCCGKLTSGRTS